MFTVTVERDSLDKSRWTWYVVLPDDSRVARSNNSWGEFDHEACVDNAMEFADAIGAEVQSAEAGH